MKFGVFAAMSTPGATPEGLAEVARKAEDWGAESFWIPEHVVLFDDYERLYPYDDSGSFPAPPDAGMLEPMTTLSYLAGVTETIRLGTAICLLPQRNPVYTAKEAANVDWLSGGRLDLGIGVGWCEEEYDAVNVPFRGRGVRADDYIGVLKTCWTDDVSTFEGETYTLPECRMYPKPSQDPHPPIHIGGESTAALRRTARHGDGWFTFSRLPEDFAEPLAELDELLAAEGRTRDDVEISVCPYLNPISPEMVEGYREAGVDRVVALVLAGMDEEFEALQPCLDAAQG